MNTENYPLLTCSKCARTWKYKGEKRSTAMIKKRTRCPDCNGYALLPVLSDAELQQKIKENV